MADYVQIIAEADHPAQEDAMAAEHFAVGRCQFSGTVTVVSLLPEAQVNLDAANYRTFQLINHGQTGGGNTVVASISTDTGDDWHGMDEKHMTLSTVESDLVVAENDTLEMVETVSGTGAAHPQMKVEVRGVH
jgi:hypothetical protein